MKRFTKASRLTLLLLGLVALLYVAPLAWFGTGAPGGVRANSAVSFPATIAQLRVPLEFHTNGTPKKVLTAKSATIVAPGVIQGATGVTIQFCSQDGAVVRTVQTNNTAFSNLTMKVTSSQQ
jgi:hypothetical protein